MGAVAPGRRPPGGMAPPAGLAAWWSVQDRTGLTVRTVVRELRPLRSATIEINGTQQAFPPSIGTDQQTILDAIHDTGNHVLSKRTTRAR